MSSKQKPSRRDHLTLTANENNIELTEQELSRVAGGFLKIGMTKATISGYQLSSSETAPGPIS